MRLLPNIRLSVDTDETTSPGRQLEKIELFGRMGDHELVGITADDYDLDVSGSVSPLDRPGIGKFFEPPLLDTWDAVCAAKLDRWTRSLFDFVTMNRWLADHGKTLVVLDPMLDMSTPAGRAFASVIATFAEYEREMIADRTKQAYDALLRARRYRGGQISFGYRKTARASLPGHYLEPDPAYKKIVREMCDRYIRYESFGAIAQWLNGKGVPSPMDAMRLRNGQKLKGTKWAANVVRIVLSGPGIMGAAVNAEGDPVRDDQGEIIYMSDPLVGRDVWEKVQARIRANPGNTKVNSSALLHVAACTCGATLYATTTRKTDKGKQYEYRYYTCANRRSYDRPRTCDAPRIKAEALENEVFGALLRMLGGFELVEQRVSPGRDYAEEIAKVRDLLARINADLEMAEALGDNATDLTLKRDRARAELRRLVSLEPTEARAEPVRTGVKFGDRWESMDTVQRNEFLRSAGVRVDAHRDELPPIRGMEFRRVSGPPVADQIPQMEIIDVDGCKAVIHLGSLSDMLTRAGAA